MNERFKAFGCKEWGITETHLIFGNQEIPYNELAFFNLVTTPTTSLTNGVINAMHKGKILTIAFKHADKARAHSAVSYVKEQIDRANGIEKNYVYKLEAHTGTTLEVYEDHVIINFMQTGSLMTNIARGGALAGKKIPFETLTSVQFREPSGLTVGFLQFAYPGSIESKGGIINSINDENSVPIQPHHVELAREIVEYIENKRKELRNANTTTTVVQQTSAADELKKFKELLDMGILTQDEFDAKKKQLLGL